MENPPALTIEAKLELLLLTQGAGHDRALELLVDILIERGRDMDAGKREHCGQLILSLVEHCTVPVLARAAARLSTLDFVPHALLLALAKEAIEVARPVLEHAKDISPQDLAAVVEKAEPAHLAAIAAREDLDETVTQSLIARGEKAAIAACARNRKARLNRTSFDALVKMADEDRELRQALCVRSDLPEAVLPSFWPGCEDTDKARLLVAGFSCEEAAESAPEEEPDTVEDEEEAVKLDRQLAGIILQYSDIGSLTRLSQKLADQAGVDEGIAFDLVCGSYERGAVLLARAANLDEWSFLQLICARMKLTSAKTAPHRALKTFRDYPRDEAKKVLLEVISLRVADAEEAKRRKSEKKMSEKKKLSAA
jgi:hypothetical protein